MNVARERACDLNPRCSDARTRLAASPVGKAEFPDSLLFVGDVLNPAESAQKVASLVVFQLGPPPQPFISFATAMRTSM